ncbi:Fic family protein [Halosquirtibacter laminarini]|uniref:Fic family protein n=1 Tax=Halosquirtibacter laminarini TaxID=3374600 RepID=A0AC61NQ36_9BACT|nr:Fic family protein [Prolixibacteraceae bacterium]
MKNFISGKLLNQGTYNSFQPEKIDKEWILDDMQLIQLLSEADRELGKLDSFSDFIPDIDLFIRMHVVKEATQSSRIEGTRTNIEEAFKEIDEINDERRHDWEEVQNYVTALNQAIDRLDTLPFSTRLIKETHETLLQGVRGKHKLPGKFRTSQNWIGGASLKDATFISPSFDTVNELMSDIEKFAHNDMIPCPDLIKIAIIHYQFETIHPFLDGNGRVGRLLITLYLVEKGLLKRPVLYLSDYFEKHRMLYYDNLTRVRRDNDLNQWLKFFLVGIIETAKNSSTTFDKIIKLKNRIDEKVLSLPRSKVIYKITNKLFSNPVVNFEMISEISGVSAPTAYKIIKDLIGAGIIKELENNGKSKLYRFDEYLSLFE